MHVADRQTPTPLMDLPLERAKASWIQSLPFLDAAHTRVTDLARLNQTAVSNSWAQLAAHRL